MLRCWEVSLAVEDRRLNKLRDTLHEEQRKHQELLQEEIARF